MSTTDLACPAVGASTEMKMYGPERSSRSGLVRPSSITRSTGPPTGAPSELRMSGAFIDWIMMLAVVLSPSVNWSNGLVRPAGLVGSVDTPLADVVSTMRTLDV
ncbi:hypothetical protein Aple_087760 [Acrocarpospora pleiomorpha]|uniref:Uncharacterized protein n=1 Tax=Acrocarpospora pleiomorpha TaxID=90975 RepID=A0A5M3XXK5_9ACTN|nr:hypothetical protein Aple_087760 [Acrocarpospora pleiomorpha]